ncbi:hypothetical protein VYU27_010137 [Nannochloropsis oceanica]
MSKLNSELLAQCVEDLLAYSQGKTITKDGEEVKGKIRNFNETIELQIALKNYDPQRDKRFSGVFKLPVVPKPNMTLAVLGNALHCEEAEKIGKPPEGGMEEGRREGGTVEWEKRIKQQRGSVLYQREAFGPVD